MSYRPITDTWILARARTKYYGSYPLGFLERARALMGVSLDSYVLHVCGGKVRDYPYKRAVGPNDKTLDLDASLNPDFLQDARDAYPQRVVGNGGKGIWGYPDVVAYDDWDALLADPPYTDDDADKYAPGRDALPSPGIILRNSLAVVKPGGRVGILHYLAPRPQKDVKFVAAISVIVGFDNRVRLFSVYEKPWAA